MVRKISVLAFIVVLLAIPFAAAQDMDNKVTDYNRARPLYHKGLDAFKSKKYDDAIKSFEQALRILPEYSESALYLGICHYYKKNYEKALQIIEDAKAKYMQWYHINIGIKTKMYDDAQTKISELRQQLQALQNRLQNESPEQQGETRRQISNLERTIKSYESVDRPPITEPVVPPDYYYHCANCLLRMEKYNESFQQYHKTLELEPKHGDAHNNLAYIYFLAKQYEKSWEHMQLAKQYGAEVNPQAEAALKKAMGK